MRAILFLLKALIFCLLLIKKFVLFNTFLRLLKIYLSKIRYNNCHHLVHRGPSAVSFLIKSCCHKVTLIISGSSSRHQLQHFFLNFHLMVEVIPFIIFVEMNGIGSWNILWLAGFMVDANRQWSAKTLQIYFLGHAPASNNSLHLYAATFRGQRGDSVWAAASIISRSSSP